MTRREAMASIFGLGMFKEAKVIDKKPHMMIVSLGKDVMCQDQDTVDRMTKAVQLKCEKAGWGKNFPIIITPPGVHIQLIDNDMVYEKFEDYSYACPVNYHKEFSGRKS